MKECLFYLGLMKRLFLAYSRTVQVLMVLPWVLAIAVWYHTNFWAAFATLLITSMPGHKMGMQEMPQVVDKVAASFGKR